jgi:lysyl-tRNA synthetase class 2
MSQHTHTSDDFIGQRQRRIANLNELTKRGISCYPAQSKKDTNHAAVHAEYAELKDATLTLAGRIMKWRKMGKLIFLDLVDETGKIQICIKLDDYQVSVTSSTSGAQRTDQTLLWEELTYLDLYDFVQVTGTLGETQSGEVTLFAQKVVILAKTIRPFPIRLRIKNLAFADGTSTWQYIHQCLTWSREKPGFGRRSVQFF